MDIKFWKRLGIGNTLQKPKHLRKCGDNGPPPVDVVPPPDPPPQRRFVPGFSVSQTTDGIKKLGKFGINLNPPQGERPPPPSGQDVGMFSAEGYRDFENKINTLLNKDRWTGEICKKCGRRNNVGFRVSDDVWDSVAGDQETVWCLQCFDEEAQRKGIKYKVHNTSVVTWWKQKLTTEI